MKQAERLIEMIYKETKSDPAIPISKKQVEVVYNATIKTLLRCIIKDGGVTVPKLGIFERTLCDPRAGNDPRTHEPIEVPEQFKTSFRASKNLKGRLITLNTDNARKLKTNLAKPSRKRKEVNSPQ